ncbi:transcriptional regulator [Streptomyces viridiviolaceus]|uniref:AraC family transcriptional regulator n=1 Tax=Streptomyces viridiviolaceus TaxID=68282 RepID=A0ABW2EDX5_9ACTN|nr:AraC family transcriptional regulator [Streptomyces viridiviolaceus]GHB73998.1 transcriptional regulator [Streptomyces viridiviolaceus]
MPENQDRTAAGRPLHISTRDLDVAREQGSRSFAEHDMQLALGHELDFRLDLAPSPRVTLGRLSYGADARLIVPPMRLCYHVNLPLSGRSSVEQNGTRGDSGAGTAGVAFLPDVPLRVRWSQDARQYVIRFPRELLESHAAKLAGLRSSEGIRFDLTFDLRGGPGQALVATAGFMYAELTRPGGLAAMPTACRELEALLMTQLLMAVPNQLSPVLYGSPAPTRRSKIRAVMEFIDEHPAAATSTADLAAMVGVSARALQLGFQEAVGMSPTAYLRGVRLDRAHLELSLGTGGSVTEVAARWGFFHPSRFARQYRQRFGLLPSETARGTRS